MFGQMLSAAGSKLFGDAVGALSNSLFGGSDDEEMMRDQASINWNMQREFLQNQLQWRSNDAKAAGIHPVAALGVQPVSGSPVAVGGGSGRGPSFGDQLASEGAGLYRAAMATQSTMERLQERLLSAQIDGQEIENAKKRSDLALTSSAQMGAPMPVNTGLSVPVSMKGTHLGNGPLVNLDAVDSDSDPIGYLAARGIITSHDIKAMLGDLSTWWRSKRNNWIGSYRERLR